MIFKCRPDFVNGGTDTFEIPYPNYEAAVDFNEGVVVPLGRFEPLVDMMFVACAERIVTPFIAPFTWIASKVGTPFIG